MADAAVTLAQLAAALHEAGATSRLAASRLAAAEERLLCVICLDAARGAALLPCAHACACPSCAEALLSSLLGRTAAAAEPPPPPLCPVCRGHVFGSLRVHL